jgi:CRP-like cAMP-binding protein
VPSAPDPHRPFSAETAPPGLKPKKAEPSSPTAERRLWASPPAGSSPSTLSAAPPPAGPSDLERSLQIFAEFDVESPAPPLMASPQATVARSRDVLPPAASPSGIARAPVAAPPPPPAAQSPTGPSFTELELEGDTLFHEVSAAAARGLRKAGHDAEQVVEEAMEAPEEGRADGGGLPRIPLFSDLPEDAFIALFERCPLRRKEPGESIIRQGTRGDSFFVICSGSVKVFREEGETRHELATLSEGTFFGEMALLSDAPRTASVEAASEDTQLLEISAPILKELSEKHATVAIALRKFYRQRLLTNLMNSAPIFKPFGKNDRRTLVEKFKARDVQPGEVLIREGTPSDGLYVVLAGEVVVTVAGQPAAVLKEGDIFGEMSLLTRSPGSATVASVRRTSLLRLPREDFDSIIMSHPQILEMVAELSDARRRANAALQKKSSATESML